MSLADESGTALPTETIETYSPEIDRASCVQLLWLGPCLAERLVLGPAGRATGPVLSAAGSRSNALCSEAMVTSKTDQVTGAVGVRLMVGGIVVAETWEGVRQCAWIGDGPYVVLRIGGVVVSETMESLRRIVAIGIEKYGQSQPSLMVNGVVVSETWEGVRRYVMGCPGLGSGLIDQGMGGAPACIESGCSGDARKFSNYCGDHDQYQAPSDLWSEGFWAGVEKLLRRVFSGGRF